MRHSSDRASVEPFAALAAVLAVSAGLALYADAVAETLPGQSDRETADITLERIYDRVGTAGVIDPESLSLASEAFPSGWEANVTLASEAGHWSTGPAPPRNRTTLSADRRVSVRVAPARILPATLRVEVWR